MLLLAEESAQKKHRWWEEGKQVERYCLPKPGSEQQQTLKNSHLFAKLQGLLKMKCM